FALATGWKHRIRMRSPPIIPITQMTRQKKGAARKQSRKNGLTMPPTAPAPGFAGGNPPRRACRRRERHDEFKYRCATATPWRDTGRQQSGLGVQVKAK